MGLGKTYTGSEKMNELGGLINLVVCQKSKLEDWLNHFKNNYDFVVYDLTNKTDFSNFIKSSLQNTRSVAIINYDLIFRRPELSKIHIDTLTLDESSMIQNEQAKRSKFILKLNPNNVILLSGTPTSGKYERLWSQAKLLGWNISKKLYWEQYVNYHIDLRQGFPLKIIDGYKNVERLKQKLREHGAQFLKTDEVMTLPEQTFIDSFVPNTKEYRKFRRDSIITIDVKNLIEFHDDSDFYGVDVTPRVELVGDTALTKMLYERQLCGMYCKDKLNAFRDLLESTEDRLIVFYNFTSELDKLWNISHDYEKPCSIVNGSKKDLTSYELYNNSVTFVQYQAGSMGLNLQKANKIIYFTPPLSCENWMQSQKRIHRIGQQKPCFYYRLICKNSVEERIYDALARGVDYTDKLFESEGV